MTDWRESHNEKRVELKKFAGGFLKQVGATGQGEWMDEGDFRIFENCALHRYGHKRILPNFRKLLFASFCVKNRIRA